MTTETDASPFKAQALRNISPTGGTVNSQRVFSYETSSQNENLTEVKKFEERKHYRLDRFEYDRTGDDPGLVLIFNQENFDNQGLGTRRGSRRDVNELVICFQRQGFNIDNNNILTNGTTKEIKEKLKSVAEMDLTKYNSLIIFYLSHGEELNYLHTRDATIEAEYIWKQFKENKTLINKPKMFIFQACKGDGFSTTGAGNTSSPNLPNSNSVITTSKTFSANHLYPDLLIVYSSVEGNSSFRHSLSGSWFIQELCKNFSSYGKRDDVVSMIVRTTKCVCGNYYHTRDNVNLKQMPFFVSTLKKKFYLNRNKDRDIIIRVAESNEEILKKLIEIKEQLFSVFNEEKKKK